MTAIDLIDNIIDSMEDVRSAAVEIKEDTRRSITVYGYIRQYVKDRANKYTLVAVMNVCCQFYGRYSETFETWSQEIELIENKNDVTTITLNDQKYYDKYKKTGDIVFGSTILDLKFDGIYEWTFKLNEIGCFWCGIYDKHDDKECLNFRSNGTVWSKSLNMTIDTECDDDDNYEFIKGDIMKVELHLINADESYIMIYRNDIDWAMGKIFINDIDRFDPNKQYCLFFQFQHIGDCISLISFDIKCN